MSYRVTRGVSYRCSSFVLRYHDSYFGALIASRTRTRTRFCFVHAMKSYDIRSTEPNCTSIAAFGNRLYV